MESNNDELRVLIVDDDQNSRFITQRLLKKNFGISQVCAVDSGQEAVSSCQKQDFDIIFMDIRMPRVNGIEAMNMIKKFKPAIKFIAHTASCGIAKSFGDYGFDDFVLKPISTKILQKVLEVNHSFC